MTTTSSEPSYRVHTWPDERGRCLVATRDIEAGELVLRDQPIAFGPTSKERTKDDILYESIRNLEMWKYLLIYLQSLIQSRPVCLGCSKISLDATEDGGEDREGFNFQIQG